MGAQVGIKDMYKCKLD